MTTTDRRYQLVVMDPEGLDDVLAETAGLVGKLHQTDLTDVVSWLEHACVLIQKASALDGLVQAIVSARPREQIRGSKLLVLEPPRASLAHVARPLFRRAVLGRDVWLSTDQLVKVLLSEEPADRCIAGTYDKDTASVGLLRGDLSEIVVPTSYFRVSGDGTAPEFEQFEIIDYGETLQFGAYEASVDGVLYFADPDYRKRKKKDMRETEQSFGASVRRLRVLRGLNQDAIEGLDRKTVQRIESGEASYESLRSNTLMKLSRALRVRPDEIETY